MAGQTLAALTRFPWWGRLGAAAVVLAVSAVAAAALIDTGNGGAPAVRGSATPTRAVKATAPAPVPVPAVPAAELAQLPEATTHTSLPDAPLDSARLSSTDGSVAHNGDALPVFTKPGGRAFARLPAKQVGSETWLPVVEESPGWARVLLPTRPNGATGWLDASRLRLASTPFEVRVRLKSLSLELIRSGQRQGAWRVGIGKDDTPTPAGRTYILASIKDSRQTFSDVILPLGVHSDSLDSFGGGPGTVGIHGWPTPDVFGTRSSHGCIRVPREALDALKQVPLGTIVMITND